jgi:hypothetical protein
VHIKIGSSGMTLSAGQLLIENSDDTEVVIASPYNKYGKLSFANPTTGSGSGGLIYDHTNKILSLVTIAGAAVNIDDVGAVGIGIGIGTKAASGFEIALNAGGTNKGYVTLGTIDSWDVAKRPATPASNKAVIWAGLTSDEPAHVHIYAMGHAGNVVDLGDLGHNT